MEREKEKVRMRDGRKKRIRKRKKEREKDEEGGKGLKLVQLWWYQENFIQIHEGMQALFGCTVDACMQCISPLGDCGEGERGRERENEP